MDPNLQLMHQQETSYNLTYPSLLSLEYRLVMDCKCNSLLRIHLINLSECTWSVSGKCALVTTFPQNIKGFICRHTCSREMRKTGRNGACTKKNKDEEGSDKQSIVSENGWLAFYRFLSTSLGIKLLKTHFGAPRFLLMRFSFDLVILTCDTSVLIYYIQVQKKDSCLLPVFLLMWYSLGTKEVIRLNVGHQDACWFSSECNAKWY